MLSCSAATRQEESIVTTGKVRRAISGDSMRAVVQRVRSASVTVDSALVGQIGQGLLILLGVGKGDQLTEAELLSEKIANLRIFADDEGRFNRSILDVGGAA